ncbi:MAG TPA: restriction endonuclease subunit S [Vicinamibacterales bacterium]|nr:restriction endonuclease subunit S [Vicinamibacterales bacterium]
MKALTIQLAEVMTIDRAAATEAECRNLPYVGLEHIEKETGHFNADFRREPETLLAAKYRFTPRHVLYGKLRPNLNKVALPAFDGVCTTEILPLLAEPKALDRRYLYAVLLSQQFVKWASNSVSGANLPRLDPDRLREYEFDLPDLSEQRRIADRLEHADRLRRTRLYAIGLTDTLLPAAFLELFGDPRTNPKGWDGGIIDDVVEFSQYGTSKKSNSARRGYPVLGMGNITERGSIDLSTLAYVDLPKSEFESLALQRGDIIFNRTNSTELVGKTACWNLDMNAVAASYLVLLRLKPRVLPEFFSALLNTGYFKNLFRDRCKKAVGQSNISPTLLKEFPVYVPPLPIQEKFAALVERVERLRGVQWEASRQAEHLFASLLHSAFNG